MLRLDDELLGDAATGADGRDDDDLVLVGEAALLDALRRARTGRMGDIVSTIQAEQDRIIRSPLGGLVVVQGGPGTGKTAVALHRAAYLLYTHRFPLEEMGVLFVGPNAVFLRYIERVLPTLGESGCRMATVAELVEGVDPSIDDPPAVTRLKGEARMAEVVARAVRSRQRPLRKVVEIPFGAYVLKLGPRKSAEIVERAVGTAGVHNARRPLVEEGVHAYLLRQYRKAVARAEAAGLGARPMEDADLDDALRSSTRGEAAARSDLARAHAGRACSTTCSASPRCSPRPGVASCRTTSRPSSSVPARPPARARRGRPPTSPSSTRRRRCSAPCRRRRRRPAPLPGRERPSRCRRTSPPSSTAPSPTTLPECPECGSELTYVGGSAEWLCERFSCRREWKSAEVLSPAAAVTLDQVRARLLAAATPGRVEAAPELRTYGHVVVDEAQDLSPMEWRMLARRCPSGSMTIVGDLGQASGHWAPTSWQEVVDLVPAPRSTVVELTVNYRTPGEVMEMAARVLAEARPDLTPARSVRDAGVQPRAVEVSSREELVAASVAAATEEVAAVDGGKVAVIVPAALLGRVSSAIHERADLAGPDDDLLAAPVSALTSMTPRASSSTPSSSSIRAPSPTSTPTVSAPSTSRAHPDDDTRLALVHAGDLPPALAVAVGGRRRHQREDPVGDLAGQRDHRRRAVDALDLEDAVQHLLEVGVVAGDDAAVQVARTRDRVGLEDLGDGEQVLDDVAEPSLGELDGRERLDLVAHGRQVEVGAEAGDDAARLEAVEASLHRPAGDAEAARQLEDCLPAGARPTP